MADVRTNNYFFYGETGRRMDGIRDSEIARNSAKLLRNLYVTELGNLKFAKKFLEKINSISNIVEVLDTRYTFYIIITTDKIYTVNKSDNNLLYQHAATATKSTNCKMFNDSLIICTPTPQVYEFDKDNGQIGTSNFIDLLTYPVIEKETVKMEVFRVYEITVGDKKENRVMSLSKYENPKLEVKGDGVYLESSNIKLDRIYKQSRSTIDPETIDGITKGLTFGVMEVYYNKVTENNTVKQYILGNTNIEFTGETADSLYGSSYFTGINVQTKGQLTWGELKELKNNFTDAGVFGPRFYIIKDDIVFFSKIDNFFDFRNDIKDDSPFYFKPSPINNQRPTYIRSKAGNGLYITTNKGVYVVTFDKVLTPQTYRVFIASEIPALWECELIGDNFYYISEDNVIKCIQPVPNELGYESYKAFNVEKFNIDSKPNFLTKITIEGVTKLVSQIMNNVVEIYDVIDVNVFRKTSLDLNYSTKLFGYNQNFVQDTKFLTKSNLNYAQAIITLNPPHSKTKAGGVYANDFNSTIEQVSMKCLNGKKEGIKGVYILESPLNNLGKEEDDFSVYRIKKSKRVGSGYSIKILSKENEEILEILGIDTFVNVAGDN
ncbi:MAG: hypothetical protein ACRCXX_12500 [Cetobacterium sp.]|uniref:hypothetical protein n=1 Tax=Cetobacterium sp. TaxID=2071632 RepID=UPI003F3B842E